MCPNCGKANLATRQYVGRCPLCNFIANLGVATVGQKQVTTLSRREMQALLLLGSHAGKVMLVYACLKGIDESGGTSAITKDERFVKSEYQMLLNVYNSIALKCDSILEKEDIPPSFQEFLQGMACEEGVSSD